MKVKSIVIASIFVSLMSVVTLANVLTPEKGFSESENRYLAKFPSITLESIYNGSFNENFEKYTSDQFLGRDYLIGVNVLSEKLFGKKDSNGVYFGKDGFFLEKVENIDEERFEKNIDYLKDFFQYLEENKINANAMIVPTAPFVMADKLPAYAVNYDQSVILNKLEDDLGEDFINLYEVLKENEDTFYKTDHHWTSYGAFVGYKQYCEKNGLETPKLEDYEIEEVSNDFLGTIYSKVQLPNIEKDSIYKFVDGEFQVTYNYDKIDNNLYEETYLDIRDKYTYFLNGNNAVTQIKTNVSNGKNVLVIKDSFAHCFTPFLVEDFENITMIDYRYYNGSTKELLENESITDVIVMYNTINFAGDRDFYNIIR